MSTQEDDWKLIARRLIETHSRTLEGLRHQVRLTQNALPEGTFDEETGEPQDLAASLTSVVGFVDEEYLSPLADHLEKAVRWIDGTEELPQVPAEVPLAELDRRI